MTTTTPNPTPTAAEALAAAYALASSITASETDLRRAEILLGIAREVREEQQYRAIAQRRLVAAGLMPARPDHLHVAPPPADVEGKLKGLAEQFHRAGTTRPDETLVDNGTFEGERAADRVNRLAQFPEVPRPLATGGIVQMAGRPLRLDDPYALRRSSVPAPLDVTQALPVIWTVGDKAQCRHCHTPIELHEAVTTGLKADAVQVWRHKYTEQAVCATAITAEQVEKGDVPEHTFAEPEARG